VVNLAAAGDSSFAPNQFDQAPRQRQADGHPRRVNFAILSPDQEFRQEAEVSELERFVRGDGIARVSASHRPGRRDGRVLRRHRGMALTSIPTTSAS